MGAVAVSGSGSTSSGAGSTGAAGAGSRGSSVSVSGSRAAGATGELRAYFYGSMSELISRIGDLMSRPLWAWLLARMRVGGVTVHLDPGEDITCTFSNRQRGSIAVVKTTAPAGGTGFDFDGDLGLFTR